MFKRVLVLFALFAWLLVPKAAKAQAEFFIDSVVTYDIKENGETQISQAVTFENAFAYVYARSYSISLKNITPKDIKVAEEGSELDFTVTEQGDTTTIAFDFKEPSLGKGSKKNFVLTYKNSEIAQKTGQVWEVSVPGITTPDLYRSSQVRLLIPKSFGHQAYLAPEADFVRDRGGQTLYTFSSHIDKSGIFAGFGNFQVFAFSLTYHLENPLGRLSKTAIALPPDTHYQRVYYETIDPKPENVSIDEDGNWLAEYNLKAKDRFDVVVRGSVEIMAEPRQDLPFSTDILPDYLKATKYWQADDPFIISLANQLKTPAAIYNYVVTNLAYDYARIEANVQRKGGLSALREPESAICMEFTDAFIALARAAGIPAREVQGFAYTENPEIEPLSLVADVLHSWPEYWDEQRGVFVPVDPTWGNTTGGVDFFSKLDLRHFAFVIHGVDSEKPFPAGSYKLGPNPQKDVFVTFGTVPIKASPQFRLVYDKKGLPLGATKVSVEIENDGPLAYYYLEPALFFDGALVKTFLIESLPPFSKKTVDFSIPASFLAKDHPNKITITLEGLSFNIPAEKSKAIVYNLLFLSFLFLILVFGLLIKLGKVTLNERFKFFKRPSQDSGEKGSQSN